MSRIATVAGSLARAGFDDPSAAASTIEGWTAALDDDHDAAARLIGALSAAADPDQALAGFDRIARDEPGLLARLAADPDWARRLALVLGVSAAFGAHLAAHPGDADLLASEPVAVDAATLRAELLDAVGADPASPTPVATAFATLRAT